MNHFNFIEPSNPVRLNALRFFKKICRIVMISYAVASIAAIAYYAAKQSILTYRIHQVHSALPHRTANRHDTLVAQLATLNKELTVLQEFKADSRLCTPILSAIGAQALSNQLLVNSITMCQETIVIDAHAFDLHASSAFLEGLKKGGILRSGDITALCAEEHEHTHYYALTIKGMLHDCTR